MDSELVRLLRKQKYQLIGEHTASKMCSWARKAVKGGGSCYKQKFYGIPSHRCIQMSPCADCCTHRCVFCWRALQFTQTRVENPDSPEEILEGLVEAQKIMLSGYGGFPHDEKKYEEAHEPNQIAISLMGEPTLYPRLSEFIRLAHKRGMTTFLVTNGTQPQVIEELDELPTQLYLTLPAPDEETYLRICNPVKTYWSEIMRTLELLQSLDTRTTIRLTLVKGINLGDAPGYGELIRRGMPWFIEPKAYMHLGYSTFRLERENMPDFSEIKAFSKKLSEETGYDFEDESEVSRVCLLVRDSKVAGNRFIHN